MVARSEVHLPPLSARRSKSWLYRLLARMPYTSTLIADNERLRADQGDLVAKRVTLHDLAVRDGTLTAAMGSETGRIIAEQFAELLHESGARNYLEMQFHSPKVPGQTLCVTVRWHDGKTPDQLKCEAEAELCALREQVYAGKTH